MGTSGRAFLSACGNGMQPNKPCVYGCFGQVKMESMVPSSTASPEYITQMRSQSLDPRRLPAVLGDTTGDLRFRMFETIEPYVAGPVPGDVAVSLLQGTSDADRLAMIRLLIRHLEQPIDPLDARLMIQNLDARHTPEALAILGFSQVPEPF